MDTDKNTEFETPKEGSDENQADKGQTAAPTQQEHLHLHAVGAPAQPLLPASNPAPSRSGTLRKYTLYVLIGGLIVSALISVVAILIGQFSETIQRAIVTTILMMVHALLALSFVSIQPAKDKIAAALTTNVTFVLIVASFFTSVLGTWDVLPGTLVGKLYMTYLLALTLTLIASLLLTASRDDAKTRLLANASIGSSVLLYGLMQPWIFVGITNSLPNIYYRSIAALSVVFATLTILTTIFHRLYTAKHHAEIAAERERLAAQGITPPADAKHKGMPAWATVILIILGIFFGLPLLFALIAATIAIGAR